jgi:polyketide synthase PksL
MQINTGLETAAMTGNGLSGFADQLSPKQLQQLHRNVVSTQQAGESGRPLEIAIVGVSGRFPQAESNMRFWQALLAGKSLVEEVPLSRWQHDRYYQQDAVRDGSTVVTHCKYGAFLSKHDCFDAEFFDISAEEAALMDPQERLGLEVAWTCVEDAGYRPERLGRAGVFAGITYTDFQKSISQSTHAYTLSARVAFHCNFHGPALTVDAGCCSSLSAIHLGCQSLRLGECDAALIIGSNLLVHPDHYLTLSPMLSTGSEPKSHPYGTDDGWIPAETVAAVLLKPLPKAREDGDHIYGVIKSSHIGQEGRTSWFRAPSPKRQAQLLSDSFEKAGISPVTISYVETAANGSSLGDAIEFQALSQVFARQGGPKQFCPIGSVKANIGHGEGVSTLLQLSKVLLQFAVQKILPIASVGPMNPNICFENSPFFLQTETTDWSKPVVQVNERTFEVPRRASITSVGTGGSFGHLILEQFEEAENEQHKPEALGLPFSASSPEQLAATIRECQAWLTHLHLFQPQWRDRYTALNIAYTLATGRVLLPVRVVFLVEDLEVLDTLFTQFLAGKNDSRILFDPHVSSGSYNRQMQLWLSEDAQGLEHEFTDLGAKRVSLPGYSFRRSHFPLPHLTQEQDEENRGSVPAAAERDQVAESSGTACAVTCDVAQGLEGLKTRHDASSDSGILVPHPEKHEIRIQVAGVVLQTMVADLMGKPKEAIGMDLSYRRLGLQSMDLVELARRLECSRKVKIVPSEFFSHRTLGELAEYLSEALGAQGCAFEETNELKRAETGEQATESAVVEDALTKLYREGLINSDELRVLSGTGSNDEIDR